MSSENVSAQQLRLFIERIETLEEERKSTADDIRDVYAEAKGTGFDTKTMKAIVKLRAMDANMRQESDALLDTYRSALGLADGSDDNNGRRNPQDERLQSEILATLRAVDTNGGRVTIVALKAAIKDKAAKALTYDALTIHLGQMIEAGDVTSAPGRIAEFPEYWSI